MVNLSEDSKKTAGNLLSMMNSGLPDDSIGTNASSYDLLNAIFNIMVKKEAYKNLQDELDDDQNDKRHFDNEKRHNELLTALGKKPGVPMKETQKFDPKKINIKKYLKKYKIKEIKLPEKIKQPTGEGFSLGKIAKIGAGVAAVGIIGAGVFTGKGSLASVIGKGESRNDPTAYNKFVDGKLVSGKGETVDGRAITSMTVGEISEQQKAGKLHAVGRFQMIGSTLRGAIQAGEVNINDVFDENTQNKLFDYLLKKRPAARAYLTGENNNVEEAVEALSKEWAAIGVPYDMRGNKRQVKKGESYYAGDGVNRATISPESVIEALERDRKTVIAEKLQQQQNVGSVAMNLDQTSRDNIISSEDVTTMPAQSNINNQYNVSVKETGQQRNFSREDDRPWIDRKR